ncbi:MAG: hypothetical protein R2941_22175, partial [Desulfobacterales bacterium]
KLPVSGLHRNDGAGDFPVIPEKVCIRNCLILQDFRLCRNHGEKDGATSVIKDKKNGSRGMAGCSYFEESKRNVWPSVRISDAKESV